MFASFASLLGGRRVRRRVRVLSTCVLQGPFILFEEKPSTREKLQILEEKGWQIPIYNYNDDEDNDEDDDNECTWDKSNSYPNSLNDSSHLFPTTTASSLVSGLW